MLSPARLSRNWQIDVMIRQDYEDSPSPPRKFSRCDTLAEQQATVSIELVD
jgi:hypothetical protein